MLYAGIGSRETPENILDVMHTIAAQLAKAGWKLRSGGALGADSAFEEGCDSVNGAKEIHLPWRYYNQGKSQFYNPSKEAENIASSFHPAWDKCSQGARKLHARNVHILTGENIDTPVNMVVCWTVNGEERGGTAMGMWIAKHLNIPIFNLAIDKDWDSLQTFVENFKGS